MKLRWKRLMACGLACAISMNSTALIYAADSNGQVVSEPFIAEEVTTEDVVEDVFEEQLVIDDVVVTKPEESETAVTNSKKVSIAVEKKDEDGRYYSLTLKDYTSQTKPKSISFAVWNESDGYTVWHTADYVEAKDVYTADVDMSKYAGSGTYITHCYREDVNGTKTFVASTTFEAEVAVSLKPVITKEGYTDDTKEVYVIEYSNVHLAEGEVLRAAVWSEKDGQDDLNWTTFKTGSDNKATLTISVNDYLAAGVFQVHIYRMSTDGAHTFVESRTFDVPKVTPSRTEIVAEKNGDGTTSITIKNLKAPDGVEKVRIPIWSADNQSDIHWYTAVKSGNDWTVKMDLKNHKNNWANYNIHVYATDMNGNEFFAGSTTVDYSFKEKTPKAVVDKKEGTVQIEVKDLQFPEAVSQVRVAVWSETDGQDDLTWNALSKDANNNWSVEVPLTKLKSAGKCEYHIYAAKANGTQIYVGGGSFVLEAPTIGETKLVQDNKAGTYTITVEDVSEDAVKVEVAVWSKADKSDCVTYTMTADDNAAYKMDGSIKDHNYYVGMYQAQIYVTDTAGIKTSVHSFPIEFKNVFGAITVTGDKKETEYTITVENLEIPAGIKGLEFAVWSVGNGQDDVVWYKASANGADYSAVVDIRNHKTAGKYTVHVYATNMKGEKVCVAYTEFVAAQTAPSCKVNVQNVTNQGTFEVVLSDIVAPSGVKNVKVAVWPAVENTMFTWYDAQRQADGTYKFTVNVADYKYYCGEYAIHTYVEMGNGIQNCASVSSYEYKPTNFIYVLKDQGKGKRTIGIYNPSSTTNVKFAVWSEANGQDDCHWYQGVQAADGSYRATIVHREFEDPGMFQVHAYADATALSAIRFDFPKSEFAKNGWYYEEINGRVYKLYYIDDVLQRDVRSIVGKQSSYKAEVNRTTCTVTMYAKDGSNGYIIPVCAFACSVGLPSTPTPVGTFNTKAKYRWHELMGPSWGQYCTRIVGGILFHSVAGHSPTVYNINAGAYNLLGQPASHGCVRLCVRDAKWIYDNCPLGMTVRIYDSSYPGPLGKPATIKIPAWQNWDPTDPAVQ